MMSRISGDRWAQKCLHVVSMQPSKCIKIHPQYSNSSTHFLCCKLKETTSIALLSSNPNALICFQKTIITRTNGHSPGTFKAVIFAIPCINSVYLTTPLATIVFFLPSSRYFISTTIIITRQRTVVSVADPSRNVSWMLFPKGRSSELRLRRGVGQAAHTFNNPQIECNGVLLCVSRE